MRIVVMTAAAIALLTISAHAQTIPGQAPWQTLPKMNNADTSDEQKPATTKPNEKAYRSALDSIAPKQAPDPWGNVRQKPQSNNSR